MNSSETKLIGLLFTFPEEFKSVATILSIDDFQLNINKTIWNAMNTNWKNNIPITYDSTMDILGNTAENVDHLVHAMDIFGTQDDLKLYTNQIIEKSNKLKWLKLAEIIRSDKDSDYILDIAKQIQESIKYKNNLEVSNMNVDYPIYMDKVLNKVQFTNRIYTGFKMLDEKLMIQGGQYILIGARTSVGKSAFSLNIIYNLLRQNKKVLLITTEMNPNAIYERFAALYSEVDSYVIKNREWDRNQHKKLEYSIQFAQNSNLKINAKNGTDIKTIVHEVYKLHQDGEIDVLFVDYLQRIKGDSKAQSKAYEIGEVSHELQKLANDLNIPVFVAAQVNRGADENEKPSLVNIKDSGQIEQDVDVAIFLHNKKVDGLVLTDSQQVINMSVSKNRNGSQGEKDFIFDKSIGKFNEISIENGMLKKYGYYFPEETVIENKEESIFEGI